MHLIPLCLLLAGLISCLRSLLLSTEVQIHIALQLAGKNSNINVTNKLLGTKLILDFKRRIRTKVIFN